MAGHDRVVHVFKFETPGICKTKVQKIQKMKLISSLTKKEECGGNDLLLGKQDHKEVAQAKGHNAPIRFANMNIYKII